MARTKQSINILNRLVTWTERRNELEGDARHAEIIIREMAWVGGKITTPLVKERIEEVENAETLFPENISRYRSVSMRPWLTCRKADPICKWWIRSWRKDPRHK